MKIAPITFGLPPKEGTDLQISILTRDIESISCTLYYAVKSIDGITLAQGNIALTDEEYDDWKGDNAFLKNLVFSYLGLEPYVEEEPVQE